MKLKANDVELPMYFSLKPRIKYRIKPKSAYE